MEELQHSDDTTSGAGNHATGHLEETSGEQGKNKPDKHLHETTSQVSVWW
jgi:hypothetical protein